MPYVATDGLQLTAAAVIYACKYIQNEIIKLVKQKNKDYVRFKKYFT